MSPQQHIDAHEVVGRLERLEDRVDDLEAENERLRRDVAKARDDVSFAHDRIKDLAEESADGVDADAFDELRNDLRDAERRLHSQRTRVERRVTALEDEVGVDTDPDATYTPLTLLDRVGPEAVADSASVTLDRAHSIVTHRREWGEIRTAPKYGQHLVLATRQHGLKSHLEAARGEDLSWAQIHRAIDKIVALATGGVELDEEYGPQDEDWGKALVWTGGGD